MAMQNVQVDVPIEQIDRFDLNEDGEMRIYRRMSQKEMEKVLATRQLQPHIIKPDQNEVWLSTSLKHSRDFENKKVNSPENDVVIAFYVDVEKFCKEFENGIIHQHGSKSVNANLILDNLKALYHDENLANHPWNKVNFCMKGRANVEKFNRCIMNDARGINKIEIYTLAERDGRTILVDPHGEEAHSSESESRMHVD